MSLSAFPYRSEEGRLARGTAFWMLVALAYYGAMTLYHFLSWDWAQRVLGGYVIPVVEIPLTPAFLIAAGVFLGSLLAIRYALNHPKLADLLIDTEAEMRRVTWPSWSETWNGSIVVVVTVIAMLILLAGADLLLTRIFEDLVF